MVMSAIAPSDRNKKNAFLYSVQLQVNEIALEMTALCDTGAQTPLVISPRAAKLVAYKLGATIKQLPKPIQYVDYRGKIPSRSSRYPDPQSVRLRAVTLSFCQLTMSTTLLSLLWATTYVPARWAHDERLTGIE